MPFSVPVSCSPDVLRASQVEGVVSKAKAVRATEDARAIVDALHGAAITRFPYAGLLPGGLEGILSMRSTTAQLKE